MPPLSLPVRRVMRAVYSTRSYQPLPFDGQLRKWHSYSKDAETPPTHTDHPVTSSASTTSKPNRRQLVNRSKTSTQVNKKAYSSRTLPRQSAVMAIEKSSHESEAPSISSRSKIEEAENTAPLSLLSLKALLRGIAISTISSSPLLLPPSLIIMSILAHSQSPFLNPDSNPVLRFFLKNTFYAQFCAGEDAEEVSKTVNGIKDMGCEGVMLCYAKEAEVSEEESKSESLTEEMEAKEIEPWKLGTMETVAMTERGNFVALKFTGAGPTALNLLSTLSSPSKPLDHAIIQICTLASQRGVRLLFDAEHAALQPGVDSWTLKYMRLFNKNSAVIYSTYQAYLKRCPQILASHLSLARAENWILGVKLVRGAYIASDPRELICDTIEDTHAQYDGLAEAIISKRWNGMLKGAEEFPEVSLVLAGHNLESARKAMALRNAQPVGKRIDMVYAQLQGMADEVSCELVQAAKAVSLSSRKEQDAPRVFKYLVWGSTGECMKYLLRRAQENKDAVGRTREGRNLMLRELGRRMRGVLPM